MGEIPFGKREVEVKFQGITLLLEVCSMEEEPVMIDVLSRSPSLRSFLNDVPLQLFKDCIAVDCCMVTIPCVVI
eukprot:7757509-Lingulodinium_polyedra.AAC.1